MMVTEGNTKADTRRTPPCSTAALILAAGGGSRMGALKQLLAFEGGTLLSNVIEQAKAAGIDRIAVVLGSHAEAVAESIEDKGVETTVNPQWSSGMGSSIRAGMKHFHEYGPVPERVAILLTDQPLIRSSHIAAMLALQSRTGAPVVAAEYEGRPGVPAVFSKTVFPFLEELPLETGAKHLLRGGGLSAVTYPLPEAALDLDTPADLTTLEAMRS